MWDANQYLKYREERSRPFFDLLARVNRDETGFIVDLGCGPGSLTSTLHERWPNAPVVGVDNAPEMLMQAASLSIPGRIEFVHADIANWRPNRPVDLIVSNAALQWVGEHDALLSQFAGMLAPRGTLAVQMPYHFDNPAHLAIEEAKLDPRWSNELRGVGLNQQSVAPLSWYVDRLHDLGFLVDAWQTTYIHVLTGDDPVLEWYKGSALRPLLERLTASVQVQFLADLALRFKSAYPSRAGLTLLPFPRLFFVATRA